MFFFAYSDLNNAYHPWQMLPAVILFILADIVLIFLFRLVEKNTKLQTSNEMFKEEISSQTRHYEQLEASYDQIRKLRHDIDNHLYSINALISSGQVSEAADYAREISEAMAEKPLFLSCSNQVLATFLEKRIGDLEQKGIALEPDIRLPNKTGISNPDLICIFGNIIDNAQESCEGIQNAKVALRADYMDPYLSISCDNPIGRESKENRKKIPGLERGLGFLILNELAGKYDGEFHTEAENGNFRTELILKGAKQNA